MVQHERNLLEEGIELPSLAMSSAQLNPKKRTVQHWYEKWQHEKYGAKDDKASLEVSMFNVSCNLKFLLQFSL